MKVLISGEAGLVGLLGDSPELRPLEGPRRLMSSDQAVYAVFSTLADTRALDVANAEEAQEACRLAWRADRAIRLTAMLLAPDPPKDQVDDIVGGLVEIAQLGSVAAVSRLARVALRNLDLSRLPPSVRTNLPREVKLLLGLDVSGEMPTGSQIWLPKATAVWLVDNTSLILDQIADFCGLHPLEVKGIADGEVARDMRGADPIANGQLSREELDAAEKNPNYRMKAQNSRHAELLKPAKKGPRYTPVSRRQDRPDAIAWFLLNHPEVPDSQVARLLGTTKATIDQVRNRTHWNSANIKPVDPVTLGLASQLELDHLVERAKPLTPSSSGSEPSRLDVPDEPVDAPERNWRFQAESD